MGNTVTVAENFLSDANSTLAGMLLFSLKQAASADNDTLRKIGFTPELIRLLQTMDMEDIAEYARYGSKYMRVSIDPKRFEQIHDIIHARAQERQLINSLLRAHISYQFLHDQFGMTSNEILSRKTRLRMVTKAGRSKALTERETAIIYRSFKKESVIAASRSAAHWYPELILAISQETGIDAGKVANLVSVQEAENLL